MLVTAPAAAHATERCGDCVAAYNSAAADEMTEAHVVADLLPQGIPVEPVRQELMSLLGARLARESTRRRLFDCIVGESNRHIRGGVERD